MVREQLLLKNQLCFRLYTAARLVTQSYYPYFEALGITYPQYLVLLVLWETDSQPVNDIAHKLKLETNTVTPLLQRMEKQGLIKRERGEKDSRQRIVSLTQKGRELQAQAASIPECVSEKIMQCVEEPQELAAMLPLLDKLIKGLSE